MDFIILLDKDPAVNVQYLIDHHIREGCLTLTAAFLTQMSLVGGYSHPRLMCDNLLAAGITASRSNWVEGIEILVNLHNEHELRFERESPAKVYLKKIQEGKLPGFFSSSFKPWPVTGLPNKYRVDDNFKPWHPHTRDSNTLMMIQNPKKPSVINSFRKWYKEGILREDQFFDTSYTNRNYPEIFLDPEERSRVRVATEPAVAWHDDYIVTLREPE
jgi:hypothetical protein